MRQVTTLSIILIVVLVTSSFLVPYSTINNTTKTQSIYLGVSFCGNTTTEAKTLIDKVKDYTNLFVLQSGVISTKETATNEICDYAANANLHFIVYFFSFHPNDGPCK